MTTLVTGSGGLIGSALRKVAEGDYYFAERKDGDLRKYEDTYNLFTKVQPDKVIHLAALVGGVEANSQQPGTFFIENSMVNLNVLSVAKEFKVQKLVSFISTCVFPDKASYPLSSLDLHAGAPHSSNFGYAYAKRMQEVQSRAFRQEFGLNFITLVAANVYGPGDNWKTNSGHVVPSLIHKTHNAKKFNQSLSVWGDGTALREFVYSDDIARLTLMAMEDYDSEVPLILSNSKEISIKELVKKIAEAMEFNGEILWDRTKPNGQARKPSDSSPLKAKFSDFKFTSIEDGLTSTVKWFVENYDSIVRK
jgi:GDP-L-fucose synthase